MERLENLLTVFPRQVSWQRNSFRIDYKIEIAGNGAGAAGNFCHLGRTTGVLSPRANKGSADSVCKAKLIILLPSKAARFYAVAPQTPGTAKLAHERLWPHEVPLHSS
jgi:hypothetical protein